MSLAPVVLFVYNRPAFLKKTVDALANNYLAAQSDLFVFSDAPKKNEPPDKVLEVRNYIKMIRGFKSITISERMENFGLAKSVISGVTEVIKSFGKVIVLEDDLISSPNFLNFANACLDKYQNHKNVFSIASYTYNLQIPNDYVFDNYFTPRCESLGWGTWIDRWEKVDWDIKDIWSFLRDKIAQKRFSEGGDDLIDMLIKQMAGKLDSWAVRWCYAHYKNNALCSYPVRSKIVHIGIDKTGTNVKKKEKILETELDESGLSDFNLIDDPFVISSIMIQYKKYFKRNLIKKLKREIQMFLLKRKIYSTEN